MKFNGECNGNVSLRTYKYLSGSDTDGKFSYEVSSLGNVHRLLSDVTCKTEDCKSIVSKTA